tara:strand:+ start:64 stop:1200 length:1137 start_codon:yes stop_codon:yes gene_type:complete
MSGGGGGSGNDGSNDMQVSGMEAAMSKEKGISTYSESRVGPSQSQRDNDGYSSMDNEEQAAYDAKYSAPDTSTVGMASDSKDYFSSPQNPPGVSTAFDYETEAYTGDNNIDAGYGQGKITSAVYDAKTGKTNIEQTVGIIDTATYQTANLQAYLDSPDVSDKDKVNTLNALQALSNSNVKSSKLNNVMGGQKTKDFVVENLDLALGNIKNQIKNSKYTSQIDENARTAKQKLDDDGLIGVIKQGGIIGTAVNQLTDHFKNNKALKTLGYTGKVIKEPSSRGDSLLTGVQSQGDRDAMNQLAPSAPFIASGTQQPDSVAAKFFGNSANKFKFDFQTQYTKALANQKALLNKPSAVGLLAVNQSPFYNWLKDNSLDKGIL